ncbi:MAG TPA: pyridoxal-dependent decarboxylase [Blastocatellia bacterium]|nr:pyridoxal-dependent decarboxylase [Blastocatellia bacterium]
MTKEKSDSSAPSSLGDMSAEEFRRYGHQLIDWVADYLSHPERYPVLSRNQPGDVKRALPAAPPAVGESFDQIIEDLDRVIVPGMTHWNHPAFFAYFSNTGSGPGILGELLAAAFNINAMLWRTSPAATELEEVTLDWLRQMIGLPETFSGVLYDTASMSSLCAIAAAREAAPQGRLRLYASEQAHSSIEKSAITLGLGRGATRAIPTDDEFRMNVEALAAAIAEDRAAGWQPFCVTATVGTTSTTSIDPVPPIADICEREKLWLHVDAAYAGSAAVLPEMKWILAGAERADSLVMNPHKWLFVPVDLSILYCRRMDVLKAAFSLVPEYLRTSEETVRNYMDYGPQLGRRFRALKLWFVLRYFGVDGIAARLRHHIEMARQFAAWVDESDDFERLAPAPFSTVCFRAYPSELRARIGGDAEAEVEAYLDLLNERMMEEVNRRGKLFLSHTKLRGKFTLRIAIGNVRTMDEHVRMTWDELNAALQKLDAELRPAGLKG